MSDVDLGTAIEASGVALAGMARDWYCPKHPDRPRYMCEWCLAEVAVIAAAPMIEAQVRAEIEAEIEAALPPSVVTVGSEVYVAGIRDGLHTAARIVRGESP